MGFIISNFKKGVKLTRENPQLIYTLFTALVIFLSFIFVSNNFLSIAKDAQDRLVNVRIGSIHDVLKEFTPEYLNNPDDLSRKMIDIAANNETIGEFRVVVFQEDGRRILSSISRDEIGNYDFENDFLYGLSVAKSEQSLTTQDFVKGKRVFKTVRAIKKDDKVVGAIYTSQSLSMADQLIAQAITNSIIILFAVLILIMLLFFRHARIIDYAVLYRRLKEINKIKDDFISIATHELRTPLTVIRGYLDLLKSSERLDPSDRKLLDNADLHSKRLSLLIDDILSVPKIEQNRIDYSFENFNPEKEIEETVNSFRSSAEEKNLSLSYQIESSAIIHADKTKLRQILINIIGNAIKYTKEGEISVHLSSKENRLMIRVSDTGVGMSAEEQRGLFQKFYRVRTKETEDVTGTGLGLWISSKFIEAMDGKISVESIKGIGTHFILSFPLAKPEERN